jgi:transcription initiation factor TFIID TATA-box-binding protein
LDIVDPTSDTGFTVQNIVCIGELNRNIDLNALSIGLGLEATEYEPEQFPGLVYRPSNHPAVTLVFASGKVVITGTPDLMSAEETFRHLQTRVSTLLGT